jgi:drug/metabolite transporter (DMT)-like permease
VNRTAPRTSSSLALRADAALVAVTLVWGSSFVVIRNALQESPPFPFLFWRFVLATLLLLPFALRRPSTSGLARDGIVLGLVYAASLSLQFAGQVETTASNAGFLAGLSVVLTPFVAYVRTRRLPSVENGAGFALAGAGFFLLTLPAGRLAFARGDLLVLASSVFFALYIVEVAARAGSHDALRLTLLQLAVIAGFAGALAIVFRAPAVETLIRPPGEDRPFLWTTPVTLSLIYLASVGGVGVFVAQNWAQRHMSATHAAILFALEPVFAALLAAWLLGERLGPRGVAGGALVFIGIVVSELRFVSRES